MDIVERLRKRVGLMKYNDAIALMDEVANEIERLREEMERIADLTERWPDSLISQVNEIARAALKEKE